MIERTGLTEGYSISRLIHGGWQFSAGHRLTGEGLDAALDVLVASADLGVTTFDCADIYTGVEELYGRFLRRWRSTSVHVPIQIHTKFVPDYDALESVDRAYVARIIDRSLVRLGVDCLDLVQYYWWRDDVPGLEQTAVWLGELRDAGKIRHVAGTNLSADRVARIEEAGVRLVANQVQYSALDRRPAHALSRYAETTGMGLLCFGVLAGGFLSDRWLGEPDPTAPPNRSLVKYRLIIEEFGGWPRFQDLLAELRVIADEHDTDVASVALRFVLDQAAVAAVVVGATRLGQMERNAQAFRFELSEDERTRIRVHLDGAAGPAGPVFALERDRNGPHGRIMHYNLNREPA